MRSIMGDIITKMVVGRKLQDGELNLFLVKGILVFQACVIVYYVFNIALNFLRYVLSWNSSFKKGAHLPL